MSARWRTAVTVPAVTIPEGADTPLEPAESAPETAVPAPQQSPWRRRSLFAAVVVVSMLLGAAAATGVLLVTGLPTQPVHRYVVNIYLEAETTADQKAAIEAALPAFNPSGDVHFEDQAEAWRKFQVALKSRPDLLRSSTKEDMPESFRLETKGRVFDCAGYTKVRHMPGVDKIQVLQRRMHGYIATITCDAEYAKP